MSALSGDRKSKLAWYAICRTRKKAGLPLPTEAEYAEHRAHKIDIRMTEHQPDARTRKAIRATKGKGEATPAATDPAP